MEEKKRGDNEEKRGGGGIAGSVAAGDLGVDGADGVRVRVRVRLCGVVVVGDGVVTFTGTKIDERGAKENEFEIHRGEHWGHIKTTINYVRVALTLLLLLLLLVDSLRSRFCVVCCCSASAMRRTHASAAASLSTTKKADLAVCHTSITSARQHT